MSEKPKATMQRQKEMPYYWVLTETESGTLLDIDKYQNDLIPRWEGKYEIVKVGD